MRNIESKILSVDDAEHLARRRLPKALVQGLEVGYPQVAVARNLAGVLRDPPPAPGGRVPSEPGSAHDRARPRDRDAGDHRAHREHPRPPSRRRARSRPRGRCGRDHPVRQHVHGLPDRGDHGLGDGTGLLPAVFRRRARERRGQHRPGAARGLPGAGDHRRLRGETAVQVRSPRPRIPPDCDRRTIRPALSPPGVGQAPVAARLPSRRDEHRRRDGQRSRRAGPHDRRRGQPAPAGDPGLGGPLLDSRAVARPDRRQGPADCGRCAPRCRPRRLGGGRLQPRRPHASGHRSDHARPPRDRGGGRRSGRGPARQRHSARRGRREGDQPRGPRRPDRTQLLVGARGRRRGRRPPDPRGVPRGDRRHSRAHRLPLGRRARSFVHRLPL